MTGPAAVEYQLLRLPDGRDLEYAVNGVDAAAAVVFHQGTLSDLLVWGSWLEELEGRGVRAIAINRTGYGRSTAKPDRIVRDVAADVSSLLTHLGVARFVSVGWSGGGPHALADGLDDRCLGVVTLAGLAPFDAEGLDFYDGLKDADVREYEAALRDVEELVELMHDPAHGLEWCEPDARALASDAASELTSATARCLSFGEDCLRDDYHAYLSPWGFDVTELRVPVVLFQGDLDENVPAGHARWLGAHITGARVRLYPGEGHVSLVLGHRDDIVASLVALLDGDAELVE